MRKRISLICVVAIILCQHLGFSIEKQCQVIVDSGMTFSEAVNDSSAPEFILEQLELIDVEYYSFDGKIHRGQLVLNSKIVDDIKQLFRLILREKFPVNQCIPIVRFNWDDIASMEANNTSMFNYRKIKGSEKLSNHSYGIAIDINPMLNPVDYLNGEIEPDGAEYNPLVPGTLSEDSSVTLFLKQHGWRWGGDWNSLKDWQHFDRKQ